jgi:hypothetical protein
MKRAMILGAAMCLALVLGGCGGGCSRENISKMPAQALMQDWLQLPKAGFANMNREAAIVLTQEMAKGGPDGLKPLFDVLTDASGDPVAKVLATISLAGFVNLSPDFGPRLLDIAKNNTDETSRACAVNLLGFVNARDTDAWLKELAGSDVRRVRVEALLALIMRNDREALGKVAALWNDAETSEQVRSQLLNVLPEGRAGEFLDILTDALAHPKIDNGPRLRAVMLLARAAGSNEIPALQQCADKDASLQMRAMAVDAIKTIQQRLAGGKKPVPASDAAPSPAK